MYVRNYRVQGRNKIQDLWGGEVYTIAPVDTLEKVNYVHRTMLKPHVGVEPPSRPAPVLPSVAPPEK